MGAPHCINWGVITKEGMERERGTFRGGKEVTDEELKGD